MCNIEKTKKDIDYTVVKLKYFINRRDKYLNDLFNSHLQRPHMEHDILNEAQFYTDAILQTMATLTDYYFIWVSMKLGCKENKICSVQYKAFSDKMLIASYNAQKKVKVKVKSISSLSKEIDKEIQMITGKSSNELCPKSYDEYYFHYALSSVIKSWGIPKTERDSHKLVDDVLYMGFYYLEPFMANSLILLGGVKYNIYLTINNYLKHNSVPVVIPIVEYFQNKPRIFAFFNIENEYAFFLRDSYLKEILLYDFDDFKKELCTMLDQKKRSIEIPYTHTVFDHVNVDINNGCFNEKEGALYFFVDDIAFIKKKDSLLIEAAFSLQRAAVRLSEKIKSQMVLQF